MKILVPIKRVPDPYSKVRPLPDGTGLDLSGVKCEINPFDEIALEEAVRIKERDPGVEIVAVSIGGPESEEQLRKALAIGADSALLLESPSPFDPSGVAGELEALARDIAPDIILMGKQATDDDSGQVGPMLAAKLSWPQATFASNVEIGSGHVNVTRETDTGTETLRLSLPCLITTDLRLNEPRYVALPGIIKARSKPLEKRPAATAPTRKIQTRNVVAPPPRASGQKVADVDALVAALKAKGALP